MMADHLLFEALGHFFQEANLWLGFVFSMENEAGIK